MTQVGVVGGGYVGTVLAASLAWLGSDVTVFEKDPERLQMLRAGTPYFHEERLPELLAHGIESGRLSVTDSLDAAADCDVIFLCVGTPPRSDGYPDMSAMKGAVDAIGPKLHGPTVLVMKSTVPIGSGSWLRETVEGAIATNGNSASISVVSNPEFLREGVAVGDFLHPARIVVGSTDDDAMDQLLDVYRPIIEQSFAGGDPYATPHVVKTDHTSAEMIKYASNAFLAGKISFINEIAKICEHVGSDILTVSEGVGLDPRIGPNFLAAGAGWGGSCFGKDLQALISTARDHHLEAPMLQAIADVNNEQRETILEKLRDRLATFQGRRVTVLGLSFKPGTDDTRDSPSLAVAEMLMAAGAEVVAYDPMVKYVEELPALEIADDPYSAARDSAAVVLLTAWPALVALDMQALAGAMSGTLVMDGRNALDPGEVAAAGLEYVGMGRR